MKKLVLIGQGGHAKVITDIVNVNKEYQIIAVFDDMHQSLHHQNGVLYGPVSALSSLIKDDDFKIIIAIGNNDVRKKIVEQLNLAEDRYATVIHPTAIVSDSALVGFGTVIMPNAVVNANTTIGRHAIINTGAVIEHDNEIGDFVHISPNSTLTGMVTVGEGVHVGASATIIPMKKIGNWAVIGAGSTVISNIPSCCTAVGLPAKVIKKSDIM
ncbi:acetyltransferase [Bacillus sp. FSL K6-0067]|uniref:acetyltransferase n=1 Tax=Bacillus sp. FSL K6-0067 TaxID=2921412 RepID=UPI00077A98F8|nr:acetyltransferase [Bacillus cereus]KXY35136.1 acetyltransferase [Bacillus cereus]